jgi:hypothetical protein
MQELIQLGLIPDLHQPHITTGSSESSTRTYLYLEHMITLSEKRNQSIPGLGGFNIF